MNTHDDPTRAPAGRDWLCDPRLEAAIGGAIACVVGLFAIPFAPVPLAVWIASLLVLHGAAIVTLPHHDAANGLRLLALMGGWCIGLAQLPGDSFWYGMTAFMVALGASLCANWRRATLVKGALAQEQGRRGEVEAALLQAVEEIRRLRIDVKTGGEVHQHLSAALQESSGELMLSRSKVEALATTVQRIMPFEAESGLLNADKFRTVLGREAARMQRQEMPLTMVCVKLDHFTQFHQMYGRLPYEVVIKRMAEILHRAGNRPGDVAARLGDDTFALLFPEVEHYHGLKLAEAVRARLYQLGVPNRASAIGVVTASLGTATILPNSDTTAATLWERAEAALYEASFQGGNRCLRFRTAQTFKVERWDRHNEGVLTMESLRHKLAILGYDGRPKRFKPGDSTRERRIAIDSVDAVIEGTLQVMFEGETRTLRPGDCLYLPKGTVAREEALGSDPVLCIQGTRM